jgi:prolipoprotein diacylglyceryltransferase
MVNGELVPRHPSQLYEALAYFFIFIIGFILYKYFRSRVGTGFFFGWCLTSIFTFRFFVEFIKDIQVDFEKNIPLDMGQILSIPFIAVGLYFLFRKKPEKSVQ